MAGGRARVMRSIDTVALGARRSVWHLAVGAAVEGDPPIARAKKPRAGRSEQHSPFVAVAEVLPPKREAKAAQLGMMSCVTGRTCAWAVARGERVARAVRWATMVCRRTRKIGGKTH